jgi:hypothetical protein
MDSQSAVTSVRVLVDGIKFGVATYGSKRSEACSFIGNYPGCPNVGWSLNLDTSLLVDGPHVLTITSNTADGNQSSMVRAFVVDNAQQGLDATAYYKIVNLANGKVLTIKEASQASGALIVAQPFTNGANQLWRADVSPSGHYIFEALNTSNALCDPQGATSNGTQVQQFQGTGSAEEAWTLIATRNGNYAFLNGANGKALDLQGEINDYNGSETQQWSLVPVLNPPSGLYGSGGSEGQELLPPKSSFEKSTASPSWLRALPSKPGGLESAARRVGHLTVPIYKATAVPMDLPTLSMASSAIVLCKVLSQRVGADPVTNVVQTKVQVQVDEVLRGNAPRYMDMLISGGNVIFGDGIDANVQTTESGTIETGLELVLFLSSTGQAATYSPTNGMEGIFTLSLSDGLIVSATARDPFRHLLSKDPCSLSSFRQLVLSFGSHPR